MLTKKVFYFLKPFIPRSIQIYLRKQAVLLKRKFYSHIWPIDPKTNKLPENWVGWPEKKRFALVLTHDVDTFLGQEKCHNLIKMEKELGFRSSFNFVPERYPVSAKLRHYLINNGFEVGVHGLNHDGKLFKSRKVFLDRAQKINYYLKEWEAVGFRSPSMHHNLDWIHDLKVTYDASTFDTDPFEPQPDGVGTLFPFWVSNESSNRGYVELPYTIPQDFTLFVLMGEDNFDIWRYKLDWIVEIGGMALMNTHPDYMNFEESRPRIDEYPATLYCDFLQYIESKYHDQYWHVLPKDMARFCANI